MDVIRCLRSLLDLHVQLQRAVALQGEIQAQFLAQLLHPDNLSPQQLPLPQLDLTGDDLELSLSVFERALDESKLPKRQWGSRLAKLLCVKTSDEEDHELSYEAVKTDVRRQACSLEYQRWRDFNKVRYDPHRGLRELKVGVEEAAKKWLQPERCSSEEVVRKVALQKFLSLLPPDAIERTSEEQPQNMEEAAIMAASFLESNMADGDRDEQLDDAHTEHGYSRDYNNSDEPKKLDPEPVFPSDSNSLEVTVGDEHFEEDEFSEAMLSPSMVDIKPVLNTEGTPFITNDSEVVSHGPCYSGESNKSLPRRANKNGNINTGTKFKRVLECPDCGSKFKRFDYLRKHICTPGQSLGCQHCDLRFPSLSQLTNHLRVHRKMLHCPECNKAFRDRFNLRCHQRTHTGERPHICSDCGSAFAQERGLQEHRNIHTGERPFQCPVCRKGFSHSRTLAKHVVVHSEARPYMCSDCGRAFKIKDNLHQHQKKMH
ncbi:gastrula zinc finger protein XlCGF49.1-like isoform X2, partial [Silurus asotus]